MEIFYLWITEAFKRNCKENSLVRQMTDRLWLQVTKTGCFRANLYAVVLIFDDWPISRLIWDSRLTEQPKKWLSQWISHIADWLFSHLFSSGLTVSIKLFFASLGSEMGLTSTSIELSFMFKWPITMSIRRNN